MMPRPTQLEVEYNDYFYYQERKALLKYNKLAHKKRPTYGKDGLLGEDYLNFIKERIAFLEDVRLQRNAAHPGQWPEERPEHYRVPPSEDSADVLPPPPAPAPSATPVDPLTVFCEDIPYRALNKFSEAVLASAQTDRDSEAPEDAAPNLVGAWELLQKKALGMAMTNGFPIESLGLGWTGGNPDGTPPTWEQIDTTAQWLNTKRDAIQTDLEFVARQPQKPIKIYDHKKGELVIATPKIFRVARQSPEQWRGTIEAGPEIALAVLRNQVGLSKCLSCDRGGNGASARKRAHGLKGDPGPLYLSCQCPTKTALTELWMVKTAARDPDIPTIDERETIHATLADFSFNPMNLLMVQAALAKASGLTPITMFQPKAARLVTTIEWALAELEAVSQDAMVKSDVARVTRFFSGVAQRAASQMEDNEEVPQRQKGGKKNGDGDDDGDEATDVEMIG